MYVRGQVEERKQEVQQAVGDDRAEEEGEEDVLTDLAGEVEGEGQKSTKMNDDEAEVVAMEDEETEREVGGDAVAQNEEGVGGVEGRERELGAGGEEAEAVMEAAVIEQRRGGRPPSWPTFPVEALAALGFLPRLTTRQDPPAFQEFYPVLLSHP